MQVYIGIDWSESKHDIVIMNEAGAAIARQTVPHSSEGFLKLEDMCQNLEVSPADCLFGLETAHNMVIDFLWSRSYTNVYVIPPSVVKSTRGRYGQSRARTDQSDAFLLADLLRTDRHPPTTLASRQSSHSPNASQGKLDQPLDPERRSPLQPATRGAAAILSICSTRV